LYLIQEKKRAARKDGGVRLQFQRLNNGFGVFGSKKGCRFRMTLKVDFNQRIKAVAGKLTDQVGLADLPGAPDDGRFLVGLGSPVFQIVKVSRSTKASK